MSKNLFILTAVLSSALFAGCQPDPTPIHSTHHQDEKPKATAEHSSTNANGSVVTEAHNTSHREPMNTSEGNHSDSSRIYLRPAVSPPVRPSLPTAP